MDAFHNIDNPLIQKPCMEPNKCSEVQLSNTDEKIKENWLTKRVLKRQVGKRRKSIGIGRPKSMDFVVLRLSKSSIPLQQKKRLDDDYQWDPHIDILDILREKLNGITRLTQEIHIQELFQSRLLVKKKDMSHLVKCNLRRLYSAEGEDSNEQQFISTGHTPTYSYGCLVANETVWNNAMSDHENEGQEIKTSQNLTSLFMITNNLLHSKLDEIFEATSVNKEFGDLEWRNQFLSLVNICIEQSEKLESLSVDILNAEQQVRELLFLNHSLDEQFCKQEKYYEERIREYQEAANQQKLMMDSLDELAADININIESTVEEYKKVSQDDIGEVKGMINNKEKVKRWDFSKAVSNLLHMEEKHDIVHKMRWDVGMLVEGDIDIGHNLCSFETPLNGIDRMIASSGAITEPVKKIHLNDDQEKGKGEKSSFISRTIRRIKFYQCSYALHLTHKDKQDRFALLSKTLWTPDEQASLCQFFSCKTQFSFLVRRHHCRRCGQVICHKHSMNKLPLFSSSNQFEWSRVCDVCFQDLIITQTK